MRGVGREGRGKVPGVFVLLLNSMERYSVRHYQRERGLKNGIYGIM